jgi:hypothetical protein
MAQDRTYILTEDQTHDWLLGYWDAYNVQEHVAEELMRQGITETVTVLLADQVTVAFSMDPQGRIHR